jgi:YggT family protein
VLLSRSLIPSVRGVDLATLVLVLLLIVIKLSLLLALSGVTPAPVALLVQSLYDLISLVFNIFFYAIIVQAILSWVNPDPRNPVSGLLSSLTQPILRPIRSRLPLMGGLDLSPVVALIGLTFIKLTLLSIFQSLF